MRYGKGIRALGWIPFLNRKTSKSDFDADKPGVVVGIDASRNRSGGAVAHLRGLIGAMDPAAYGITEVHLWAYHELLDAVEVQPWLKKYSVKATNGSLCQQALWQYFCLPREARQYGVDIMFNTDAGSVCPFLPSITLSQDMLSFEPGEMQRYFWPSRARFRLEALRAIQLWSLKRSTKALFLSEHAKQIIGDLNSIGGSVVVPHGIDERFFAASAFRRAWPSAGSVRCLYISNAAPYKHQWHVVEAIARLRLKTGCDFRLRLVGGGTGSAMNRLKAAVSGHDPDHQFVELEGFLPNEDIVLELAKADVFIFASSCENLPITLLEAMAAGLPIASSDRGPMPEVLGSAAVYFDPEMPESIATSLLKIMQDSELRFCIAQKAQERAREYTWKRCADLTCKTLMAAAVTNSS